MAQLFDFKRVVVGPRTLEAEVALPAGAPVMTSDDPEGTELVMGLMPELADHVCLGDADERFGGVVANTQIAHLLEHVAVELLARTDVAGDITSGRTVETVEIATAVVGEPEGPEDEALLADLESGEKPAHTYVITLGCNDDVLVTGALSSAAWILQWAYSGGGEPKPDVDAIASGLVDLVASLGDESDNAAPADEAEPQEQGVLADEDVEGFEAAADEAAAEPEPAFANEAAADVPAEPAADASAWDFDNVPRPHLVR